MLALGLVNMVLAIWRPRLSRRRDYQLTSNTQAVAPCAWHSVSATLRAGRDHLAEDALERRRVIGACGLGKPAPRQIGQSLI